MDIEEHDREDTNCLEKAVGRNIEKDPRPGPLFEGNPVGEGTTRRGTATPVHIKWVC